MTSTTSSTIVQRLWNYCNVLRDDGMSYDDYVEQLTYLLFLKMDHENSSMLGKATPSRLHPVGAAGRWGSEAAEAGLKRAGRLRHIIPEGDVSPSGEAVLRAAFEGRLV